MYAYNPITGQRIEISDYGFAMIEPKGWVRAADQTPPVETLQQAPPATPAPAVDMKAEMEKRKQEIEAKKIAGEVTLIQLPSVIPPPADAPVLPPPPEPPAPEPEPAPKKVKPKAAPGKASGKIKK